MIPAPPLARSTLDRAAHHRTDPRWLQAAWDRGRVLVVDSARDGTALVVADHLALVLLEPTQAPQVEPDERLFLGLVPPDATPIFAINAPLPMLPGSRPATLREVGHLLGDADAGLFTSAVALINWHLNHIYSPTTGLRTTPRDGGWVRADESGTQMWPRTDPAMIVLVHDGAAGPDGRCLLGNNSTWGRGGTATLRRFSCLAGFVEPGESAEAAVAREVVEEVGVTVDTIVYEGSQAWPFPGSLMLGFSARADPEDPVTVDPAEIAEARWFTRREVEALRAGETIRTEEGIPMGLPPESSIALYLINRWLAR